MRSGEVRFKCVLDLLFNMRIFAAMCLAGILSLVMYLIFGTIGFPPDYAPESVVVDPRTSELAAEYELETPYEHGFRVGYNAFLKQTGRYIPQAVMFSSKRTASYSMDDEQVSKGYVDGYHKATELGLCPRGL
jgi:hypothetical protein